MYVCMYVYRCIHPYVHIHVCVCTYVQTYGHIHHDTEWHSLMHSIRLKFTVADSESDSHAVPMLLSIEGWALKSRP